jgi:hypothetical protein
MSEAMFQHVRVIGKKFEGSSVVLDNMWFENCSFENCEVFYSGGPTETRSCRFKAPIYIGVCHLSDVRFTRRSGRFSQVA